MDKITTRSRISKVASRHIDKRLISYYEDGYYMDLTIAKAIITSLLGEEITNSLFNGLKNGKHPELGFDEKLIIDIALSCHNCLRRWRKDAF